MTDKKTDDDDFMQRAGKILEVGMKLKKVLKQRGLRQAKAECPFCGGWLIGELVGRKDHLRMNCTGCDVMMME